MSENDNPPQLRPPKTNSIVVPASASVTVEVQPRRFLMHQLTGADLDMIASLGNSVHLTFFGVCIGGTITCWVVLKTATSLDASTQNEFSLGFAASMLFSAYFGVRAWFDYRAAKRKLKEIKDGK